MCQIIGTRKIGMDTYSNFLRFPTNYSQSKRTRIRMPWAVHSFCCRAEYKVITKSCIRWCWPNQKWCMWPWQYNVFSFVWKYSVCCKCLRAPCRHGYSCLGVYVERGDIHHAHSSYNFLAETLHAVQVLSLAGTFLCRQHCFLVGERKQVLHPLQSTLLGYVATLNWIQRNDSGFIILKF